MKKQIKRPKSIKNKMINSLKFHQIDFDWVPKYKSMKHRFSRFHSMFILGLGLRVNVAKNRAVTDSHHRQKT